MCILWLCIILKQESLFFKNSALFYWVAYLKWHSSVFFIVNSIRIWILRYPVLKNNAFKKHYQHHFSWKLYCAKFQWWRQIFVFPNPWLLFWAIMLYPKWLLSFRYNILTQNSSGLLRAPPSLWCFPSPLTIDFPCGPLSLPFCPYIAGCFRLALSVQPPAHAGSSLPNVSTLKPEAIRSSEMSIHTRTTRRHIPENGIHLQNTHPIVQILSNVTSGHFQCLTWGTSIEIQHWHLSTTSHPRDVWKRPTAHVWEVGAVMQTTHSMWRK
jgi:hypothetical protein